MKMHAFIRWGKFQKQNELEIENFDNLKQVMKINNKNVILAPFQVFSRFSSISQRNITVADSLAYELTVFPMNLFDSGILIKRNYEYMSKIRLSHLQMATLTTYSLMVDG